MKKNSMAISIIITLIFLASCAPFAATPIPTPVQTATLETPPTSTPTATATETPLPTDTPMPPTSTMTPTPDYAQIQLIGAYSIYDANGSFTQLILELGTLKGDFHGIGDGANYRCNFRTDFPTQLDCFGPSVPFQKSIKFALYISTLPEPIFDTTYKITTAAPTPMGMYCEIEPLWTEVLHYQGDVGCYAVSCWINGVYYGGVQNSCKQYWPWIPPGLVPTALPTPRP
jgi:hypothetical protein